VTEFVDLLPSETVFQSFAGTTLLLVYVTSNPNMLLLGYDIDVSWSFSTAEGMYVELEDYHE
jgi:hypothetical protein